MKMFKKATKRITTIAASAVLVSSGVFGAGLSEYPNNFVDRDKFDGQVVIGSNADSAAATSIISDLKSELSGGGDKVKVTYSKSSSGGVVVSAVDDKETLNFGETLASVTEELDDDITSVLADGTLDTDDFVQTLDLLNGDFTYKVFDDIDDEDIAKPGLYYPSGTDFAKYTLDFEDLPDISDADAKNSLIGEEMTIMGNSFTVVEIDNTKLVLIGGSNKVSLGEAESTTVSIEGISYEISVQSVSSSTPSKVLLTVNGESNSIDIYDVENIGGVSIAVTDLVASSRDSVKGYASLVIGGQKIEFDGSKVKINDEDLNDIYDDYRVDVSFVVGGAADVATVFEGLEVTYEVDDNTLLEPGKNLKDVLFDSFLLSYDGLNLKDDDYSELKLSSTKDEVTFMGTLHNGKEIPNDLKLTGDSTDVNSNNVVDAGYTQFYLGSDSERIYHKYSNLAFNVTKGVGEMDAISYLNSSGGVTSPTIVDFNLSASTSDVRGNKFFSYISDDEYYIYEIDSVDRDSSVPADSKADFNDLVDSKSTNAVKDERVQAELELPTGVIDTTDDGNVPIVIANLGKPEIYLENMLMLDFTTSEIADLTTVAGSILQFSYNQDDISMDNIASEADRFNISIKRATDPDDALKFALINHDFVSNDEVETDSDFEVYVDHYGTMVTIDTDNWDDVTIMIPDEEVQGLVNVNFGGVSAQANTMYVDPANLDDKVKELEDDGYTVSTETVSTKSVDVDIDAPVMVSEVTGMADMIVVGGPAVNEVAAKLLGVAYPSYGVDSGLSVGEAVVRYFSNSNSVLVYGWDSAGTLAAVNKLNSGGLTGTSIDVN